MNIFVCIKQVLDTGATIQIQNGKFFSPGSPFIMNPYDEFAVEEAVRIKTQLPDSDVTVLSLGPESVKETLRRALAMGADYGVHLFDPLFDGLDNFQVAKVLSAAIQKNRLIWFFAVGRRWMTIWHRWALLWPCCLRYHL